MSQDDDTVMLPFDHDHGLPYIVDSLGERRYLGCLAPETDHDFPVFSSVGRTLPRGEWKEVDLAYQGLPVLDQNGYNSCMAHSGTGGFMLALYLTGRETPQLSPWFLYAQINGGRDAGASVVGCLKAQRDIGMCLESTVGSGKIFKRQIPDNAYDEAKRWRISQAYHCPNFDQMGSALQLGFICVFGVEIGSRFNPNSEGIIPPQSGRGGGHAMIACGMKQISGKWYIKVKNSWSSRWGASGYCWMDESYWSRGYVDVFAIQMPADDPKNIPVKPVVA